MLKTSELQSQIALNSEIITDLEARKEQTLTTIKAYKILLEGQEDRGCANALNYLYPCLRYIKKRIKQYAKLQRALKREMAYKIRYNRMVKEIEAMAEKAKVEGWEVVIVGDDDVHSN